MSFRSRANGSHYPVGSFHGKKVYVGESSGEYPVIDWLNIQWDNEPQNRYKIIASAKQGFHNAKENDEAEALRSWIMSHQITPELRHKEVDSEVKNYGYIEALETLLDARDNPDRASDIKYLQQKYKPPVPLTQNEFFELQDLEDRASQISGYRVVIKDNKLDEVE